MKAVKKLLGLLLAVCIAVQLLPAAVCAADGPVYLALGDSISTGFGLQEGEPGFVDRIASRFDTCTLINRSVNGNTAAGIRTQLLTGELDAALASAQLVTVTCGGNDLMAVLYVKLANLYNADHPSAPIKPTEVTDIFGGTHPKLETEDLMDYATAALEDFVSSAEFEAGLTDYAETLTQVLRYLRERCPHGQILIPTQYNPYRSFQNLLFYQDIYLEIEAGVVRLNEVIRQTAASEGCLVAEVYEAFRASEENLCNAKAYFLDPPNMDFHPNAAGHAVMAQVILHRLTGPMASVETACLTEGTAEIALNLREDALIAAAFYGKDGRLLSVTVKPAAYFETELTIGAEPETEPARLKLFVLDSRHKPLDRAVQWPAPVIQKPMEGQRHDNSAAY